MTVKTNLKEFKKKNVLQKVQLKMQMKKPKQIEDMNLRKLCC